MGSILKMRATGTMTRPGRGAPAASSAALLHDHATHRYQVESSLLPTRYDELTGYLPGMMSSQVPLIVINLACIHSRLHQDTP